VVMAEKAPEDKATGSVRVKKRRRRMFFLPESVSGLGKEKSPPISETSSGSDTATASLLQMKAFLQGRNLEAQKRKKLKPSTPSEVVWCDGEMIKGGPELANGIAARLRSRGLKPTIKILSKDKESWLLHCPQWQKLSNDEFKVSQLRRTCAIDIEKPLP